MSSTGRAMGWKVWGNAGVAMIDVQRKEGMSSEGASSSGKEMSGPER